jgi:hypothetical protein
MSKDYEDEEIVAIVEECLRGNFELTAYKHSISEHKLYRWCRQYRRPSFATLKKLSTLQEEVLVCGDSGRSQGSLKSLVIEIIDTDIITLRSMLECDYFYLNGEIDIPRVVSNYNFRSEVKSIIFYINKIGYDKQSLENYISETVFSVFDNKTADRVFLSSLVYLASAMYLIDRMEIADDELELCRENLETSKCLWRELEKLIGIEERLLQRKNYAGANKTKENANEARKKSEQHENALIELIKSAISALTRKEAYELKGSPDKQGQLIAKKIHDAVIERGLSDKSKTYNLAEPKELSCYIRDLLIDDESLISLYADKCKPQLTTTPER